MATILVTGPTDHARARGRLRPVFDRLREARADPVAYDAGARGRLWDVSAELTSAPPLAR